MSVAGLNVMKSSMILLLDFNLLYAYGRETIHFSANSRKNVSAAGHNIHHS